MEDFRKIKDTLPGIKGMLGLLGGQDNKNKEIENMLESLTLFLDNVDELVGVFDE